VKQLDPRHPHYVLEELAILDRHRRLAVTGCYPVTLDPDVRITKGTGQILHVTPKEAMIGKPLKDGDVVGTFRIRMVTYCDIEATPRAQVQIFPRDMLFPDLTFDVWVRMMQTCVLDLINDFAVDFGEYAFLPQWPHAIRYP
jgi:hypothetical protein